MEQTFKKYLSVFLLVPYFCCFSQNPITIKGKLSENISSDSIFFLPPGNVNNKCFENDVIQGKIENDQFKISGRFSYPQMFRVRLGNETGKIPYRRGFYFLDQTSTSIIIDPQKISGEVDGTAGNEFKNTFLPYFIGNPITNENNIDAFIHRNPIEFEQKLVKYIRQNPNSYVALWFLISTFSESGYSEAKSEALYSFSTKVKSGKLWKLAEVDFNAVRIRLNKKFPELNLKNTDLHTELLKIPRAKFTLVDFWFSRCKPCLEQMPSVIGIYEKYNSKGFNVIGISSDGTKNIEIWNKRIIEKKIPWKNYLDENGKECSTERIFSFPTNFLLDENGIVLKKDIDLQELEKFLDENI
jgi:thiol-disulfide isomerase/thioredoxin